MVEIPPPIPAQLHASSLLDSISPPNLKGTDLLGQSTFNPQKHDARLVSDSQGRTRGRGRASARKGTTGTRGRKTRDQGGGTTSKRGVRAIRGVVMVRPLSAREGLLLLMGFWTQQIVS